jgi:hypothetical protein
LSMMCPLVRLDECSRDWKLNQTGPCPLRAGLLE